MGTRHEGSTCSEVGFSGRDRRGDNYDYGLKGRKGSQKRESYSIDRKKIRKYQKC